MNVMKSLQATFGVGLVSVLCAVLLGVIAFLVAGWVQDGARSFCKRWEEKIGADSVEMLAQIAYLIVLLLFAPAIFEQLGAGSVTAPIFHTMEKIFSFVPNVIGAGIIFVIGLCVARILRNIVRPLLQKTKADEMFAKLVASNDVKISDMVAYLVYVLVMIPICIASLEALQITSLTQPATKVLNRCLLFIPDIVAAMILLCIGLFLARFLGKLVTNMMLAAGLDSHLAIFTGNKDFSLSSMVGVLVNCVVTLFFIVESVNLLHLPVLSRIGNNLINYLPNLLGAFFILALATFISHTLRNHLKNDSQMARCASGAIYLLAGFIALSQLRIGTYIIDKLFIALSFGIGVAFAIAFGLGGRDFAAKVLNGAKCNCSCKEEKKEAGEATAEPGEVILGKLKKDE